MRVKSYGTESYKGLERDGLIQGLLDQAEWEFKSSDKVIPILKWAEEIHLTGGIFDLSTHPWQKEILECDFPVIVMRKAAQIGATAVFILGIVPELRDTPQERG